MHTGDYYGLYEFGKCFLKKESWGNPTLTHFFFLRFLEELTEYFMTESSVSFLEKANDAIFILIKVHFGGLRATY